MANETKPLSFPRFLGISFLIFAAIFASVWLWIVKEPLAYQDYDYSIWNTKLTLAHQGKIGTLTIIGDSDPCAALLPNRISPGAVNFGVPTGTPIEVYFLSRKILAAPTTPKAVIVSILPSGFVRADYFWNIAVNYGLFDFNDLEEIRTEARFLHDTSVFGPKSPADLDARVKSLLYTIKFPSFYFPAFVNAHGFGRYRFNVARLDSLYANRGHSYFGTADSSSAPDKEVVLKSFEPSKILDYYFDQTLALYQARNVPVYFIAMPHNEASAQHYYPGLKDDFSAYLNRFTIRYSNFHVLGDTMPIYPSDAFGDPWHLNEKGATKWSDTIAHLLNDSHVEGGPFGPN